RISIRDSPGSTSFIQGLLRKDCRHLLHSPPCPYRAPTTDDSAAYVHPTPDPVIRFAAFPAGARMNLPVLRARRRFRLPAGLPLHLLCAPRHSSAVLPHRGLAHSNDASCPLPPQFVRAN